MLRDGKHIALEPGRHFEIQLVVGQPIEQIEMAVIHIQPFLQDRQNPVLLQLTVQAFEDLALPVRLVVKLGEFLCLGGF